MLYAYLWSKYGIMLISSIVGTLGFCLFFHIKKDKLLYGSIGGILSICIYFACCEYGMNSFFQNFFAAIVATLYAEIIARIAKAPSTVFLIPSVIPLTPGSLLYYTMQAVVDGNDALSKELGEETVMVALGIALGIVFISAIFYQFTHRNAQLKVSVSNKKTR